MPPLRRFLPYLLVKIIPASGNFNHALYTAARNLQTQLQRDQTRCCRKKGFLLTFSVDDATSSEYSKPDDPRIISIISKVNRFTRMLHYRDHFVPHRRNHGRTVCTAGLKRLSAILRSCYEERRQTLRQRVLDKIS